MTGETNYTPMSEYRGEPLCVRCGRGTFSGNVYPGCWVAGFTHEETCAKQTHTDEAGRPAMCDRCEVDISGIR